MNQTDAVVLLVQTAASWYMMGFIWTMQILHYPLFDRVGRDAFAAYETEHNRRFGVLVGPGIALVALMSVIQLLARPPSTPALAIVAEVLLLVVIIASTVLYQAPQHARLSVPVPWCWCTKVFAQSLTWRRILMSRSVSISTASLPAGSVGVVDARRWIVLSVVLVGGFMAILDASIMNVAIPSIRDDLHASFGDIELVVAAYMLVYAMLLITGGRLGDIYGRKALFLSGVAVFTVASALCGLASSPVVLIASRALQGIGGAMMFPQILALIQRVRVSARRGSSSAHLPERCRGSLAQAVPRGPPLA